MKNNKLILIGFYNILVFNNIYFRFWLYEILLTIYYVSILIITYRFSQRFINLNWQPYKK